MYFDKYTTKEGYDERLEKLQEIFRTSRERLLEEQKNDDELEEANEWQETTLCPPGYFG
jgi:deoxycytidine triphosphate deaminase